MGVLFMRYRSNECSLAFRLPLRRIHSIASGCFTATLILFVVIVRSAGGDIAAYKFYGVGRSAYPTSGQIAGGYYMMDPNALPYETHTEGQYRPQLVASYHLGGMGAAIDDVLADATPPMHPLGVYARIWSSTGDNPRPPVQSAGGMYYRGSPDPYLNISSKVGPVFADPPTLGSYFSSQNIDNLQGGVALVRGARIDNPTVSQFTAQDVFANPKSLQQPTTNGAVIEAKFTPHVKVGGGVPSCSP